MANDVKKKQPSNFCLTDGRNFYVCSEVHGGDIYFATSEQSYHLTSTDAEAVAISLLLSLERKRHIPVILHCMHIKNVCETALNTTHIQLNV